MHNPILKDIKNSLNNSEETGKVELSLDQFNKLQEFIKIMKTKWLKNPNSNGFFFYQAARTVELILTNMEYELKNSQNVNDDSNTTQNLSIPLLFAINKVLEIIGTDTTINSKNIELVLSRTAKLHEEATNTKLNKSLDSNIDLTDDDLKTRFNELMNNLGCVTK